MRTFSIIILLMFVMLQSNGQGLLNKKVPSFIGYMLDGTEINQSILDDKIVLLNFMFIGCKGCMEELSQINKIDKKFHNDQLLIVSIIGNGIEDIKSYQGTGDTTKVYYAIRKMFKNDSIDHLIIAECKTVNRNGSINAIQTCTDNISKKFKISVYPTNLLIDKNGTIIKSYNNLLKENAFNDLIKEVEKKLR